jgi:uncharacterized membrane protein YiaA
MNHWSIRRRRNDMKKQQATVTVLKAVTLALAVASVVIGILNAASAETRITLLGLAVFALALAGFLNKQEIA